MVVLSNNKTDKIRCNEAFYNDIIRKSEANIYSYRNLYLCYLGARTDLGTLVVEPKHSIFSIRENVKIN